ncbi:MAG: hypothetical protein QM743_03280 [Chitinophagaceae bacterium]
MRWNRWSVAGLLLLAALRAQAQELFVFSEPASNMPAHSLGLRASNWLMDERNSATINYHLIPELMWGVNKKFMMHTEAFLSNRDKDFSAEGAGLYAKYRFYSKDEVHRHFRMAVFGRLSSNNGDIHQEEIETNGHNTGYELGGIATGLLHKQAISLTVSYERALDNFKGHEFPVFQADRAINYSLSTGRLILPKHYNSYRQTNLNLMVEAIGQWHPQTGKSFADLTASVQLIFNSQTRLDIAYKKELYSNMLRTAPDGWLLRVEHLLFNVL